MLLETKQNFQHFFHIVNQCLQCVLYIFEPRKYLRNAQLWPLNHKRTSHDYHIRYNNRLGALTEQNHGNPHENEGNGNRLEWALIAPRRPRSDKRPWPLIVRRPLTIRWPLIIWRPLIILHENSNVIFENVHREKIMKGRKVYYEEVYFQYSCPFQFRVFSFCINTWTKSNGIEKNNRESA